MFPSPLRSNLLNILRMCSSSSFSSSPFSSIIFEFNIHKSRYITSLANVARHKRVETVDPPALLLQLVPYHWVYDRLDGFLENAHLLILVPFGSFVRSGLRVHPKSIFILFFNCIYFLLDTLRSGIECVFLCFIDGEVSLFGSELAGGDVFHVFIEDSLLLWTFGDLVDSIFPRIHHPHIFIPSLGSDRQQLAMAQQLSS